MSLSQAGGRVKEHLLAVWVKQGATFITLWHPKSLSQIRYCRWGPRVTLWPRILVIRASSHFDKKPWYDLPFCFNLWSFCTARFLKKVKRLKRCTTQTISMNVKKSLSCTHIKVLTSISHTLIKTHLGSPLIQPCHYISVHATFV